MAFGIITIVHAILAVFVIIELGLMADVVDSTTGFWGTNTPSSYAFMLFNSVWSLLILVYLAVTPLFLAKFYHNLAALAILVITTIFWFAGSIAMAANFGAPDCHGFSVCQTAQAAIAFGFFIWAIFTGLTVLEGLSASRGGSANADKTAPTASTV
ncbi:hypothetical protein PT974_06438 [Cladobotryum mycophilum]|uniref:MARVEL domain-containing protein n=1 Tax=Cladobotryum mycophilum TaxID=491253 RepID=A0ABR0SLJ7_9HYPO